MKGIVFLAAVCFFLAGPFGTTAQTKSIQVNCNVSKGKPKNLLGVNVGPGSSIAGYRDCGISEIRTHDYYGPSDYWVYTKNYVDGKTGTINPSLTTSYNWISTDQKIDSIIRFGFTPFFRLGISWPNTENVPTFPPIDPNNTTFSTFAEVCKRTVMHYTQGWSSGFSYQIPYWEVWNEPDLKEKFWSGTNGNPVNYFKMYEAVADSVKLVNPEIKIGGPGLSYYGSAFSVGQYREAFVSYCKDHSVPLDFYSWHLYDTKNPFALKAYGDTVRNILDRYGFTNAECFITEIHPDLHGTAYNNTPLGAAWLASAFITMNFSHVGKFFWYRGTQLGPLVSEDIGGNPDLFWNGLAYKAYARFYNSVTTLVETTGDEFIQTGFQSDTLSFLSLAGKSPAGDTVSVLISNLNSGYNAVSVVFSQLPWNGSTVVEQYTIKGPNQRFNFTTAIATSSGGAIGYMIPNAGKPSVYLLKLYRNSATSIPEAVANSNILYPNPVSDILHISTLQPGEKKITLLNLKGQIVFEEKISDNQLRIDMRGFPAGVYHLRINGDNYKVMKE
jgi:hypothetical protein